MDTSELSARSTRLPRRWQSTKWKVGRRESSEQKSTPAVLPLFILEGASGLISIEPDVRWPTDAMLLPVVNLSLGPQSILFPVDLGDAVQASTWYLSRACLVVAAAGNSGTIRGTETMSAWAQPPWVMAVGRRQMTRADKCSQASIQDVGVPEVSDSGPDVVAWGRSFIDPTRKGTSFAAPRVSYSALRCAAAILYLAHSARLREAGLSRVFVWSA